MLCVMGNKKMKKKRLQKFRMKWKFRFMRLRYFTKNIFLKGGRGIVKIFGKLQLPMIILLTLIVMGLIALFILFPQWAHIGEARIEAFSYKLDLMGVFLTAVSLIAAAITIIIAVQKPKLKIYFYNDHGSSLDYRKGEIELGIDKDGKIGYQGCVPTKWNMNLINVGSKTAEKIKIKVSFDNIYFDMSLAEKGYDLEGFQYGCGIFDILAFEVTSLLRQGEQVVLPDLPFYSAVCDADVLRQQGYTKLKILIYSGNHEPIVLRYKVILKDYDLDSFGYLEDNEDSMDKLKYRSNFYDWYISNHNEAEKKKNLYYCFSRELDPYRIEQYPNLEESRYLYEYYKSRDIEEMVFWGRIYYRTLGMQVQEVEALLQTELLKISVSETMKKRGSMSII